MDSSFGNNNGFRDRDSGRDRDMGSRDHRGGNDNGRNRLMNEIMTEMQSGMNMPNSGTNPVMNMQFGGNNPMMGNPGMNPMMGGPGMGNPMMGNPMMGNPGMGNPMMGGNPMAGPMVNPMGGPMGGLSPQITGPMGNLVGGTSNPIMGDFQGSYDPNMGGGGVATNARSLDEEEYEDDSPEVDAEITRNTIRLRGDASDEDDDSDDDMKSSKSGGMLDNIMESGKEPLIGAIILIMLLTPQFNAVFNQFVPKMVTENLIYSLAVKGLIFFVIFYLIQRFL